MEETKKKKKPYVKPEMHIEEFTPNMYVSACGGENDWTISCNVPYGFGFKDNNNNGKYDQGDTFIVQGEGCGTSHTSTLPDGQTPNSDEGYMWQPLLRSRESTNSKTFKESAYKVVYFQEKTQQWNNSNHHFSVATKGEWHKANHS